MKNKINEAIFMRSLGESGRADPRPPGVAPRSGFCPSSMAQDLGSGPQAWPRIWVLAPAILYLHNATLRMSLKDRLQK